jgi:hypothetical protein
VTKRGDAFGELVAACTGLQERLARDETFERVNSGLPYVKTGWVGSTLAEMVADGDASCVEPVLDVAERLLAEHDKALWGLITVGFLESLQNLIGHRELNAGIFTKHLGPEGRRAWNYLDDTWAGKQVQPPYGWSREEIG